jgi:hypothetical protein
MTGEGAESQVLAAWTQARPGLQVSLRSPAGLSLMALERWTSAGRPELQKTKSLRCRAEVPGATFKPKDDALWAPNDARNRAARHL